VDEFFHRVCATSPCSKDQVRKRLGPKMYLAAQKLVMMDTFKELHKQFCTEHPLLKLSEDKFRQLAPWNISQVRSVGVLLVVGSLDPQMLGRRGKKRVNAKRAKTLDVMRKYCPLHWQQWWPNCSLAARMNPSCLLMSEILSLQIRTSRLCERLIK